MDRIINLLVSINNNHFKRYLFVLLPPFTVLLSIIRIRDIAPEGLYFAGNVMLLFAAVFMFCLYCYSKKRDLFCVVATIDFFLFAILLFFVDRLNIIIVLFALAGIIFIYIIMFLVRFSPRRYG